MAISARPKKSMLTRVLAARLNRSFMILPTLVSLTGLACAALVIAWGHHAEGIAQILLPEPEIDTARSLLSTLAASAVTVLSLVYSLTLVVFTLAAGNISPRLLTRFTEDRLIQTTAGVLAATFFYAIVVLQRAESVAPTTATGVALVWSIFSITLLIVFIHKVATRITIDEEIGRIGSTLSEHIEEILEEASEERPDDEEVEVDQFRPHGQVQELRAARSGYVEAVDIEELVATARQHELFVEVVATPGQFIVEGCALAKYVGKDVEPALDDLRQSFLVGRQRTPEADLDFSVLLMVEIAQRALSPGVNDGFTAIAVIDHLSSAFARVLRRTAPSPLYRDSEGTPRVWCEIAKIDRLLGTAYHPLRREAADDVTVSLRLIASLHRLATVARPEYLPLLDHHLVLIREQILAGNAHEEDKRMVGKMIDAALAEARSGSEART